MNMVYEIPNIDLVHSITYSFYLDLVAPAKNSLNLLRSQQLAGFPVSLVGYTHDFEVFDLTEIARRAESIYQVLTALLGAIATVSLVVGGIGIMNIMLVSVTERTREIGIRLAIGAREKEVLMQFLVEAMVLASFGGIVGMLLGLVGSAIAAHFLGIPFIPNLAVVIVAFLFSGAVGVMFGYFPAYKAARLNPIDALRHE
jgi:putative ABC transport system permease protein